ncbi:hypothetical protein Hanom_Chr04g00302941 [Helianthus anomalus]
MVVLSNLPAVDAKMGQAKEALTALRRPEVNHNPTSKNLLYVAARELSRRIMGEEAGDDTMVYKTQQKFSKVHRPATATPMAGTIWRD